jgi:hypothetical protein
MSTRRLFSNWFLRENDNEYQQVFKDMLKKYGIDSPRDLPEDKRKAFFDDVDSAWKSEKEKSGVEECNAVKK